MGNVYLIVCPIGTYQIFLNNSCLESCPHGYEIKDNECIFKSFSQDITLDEFKNQISNDIVSYFNSSKVINGSNFLAVVLTSDQITQKNSLIMEYLQLIWEIIQML